ncbi:MAG: NADPH-dependent F420 reductase [Acidovorax sp.]|uniref:NADPH-dependent F420 reductase n=1 Tax=Acidovorax sp. TaxID=1872122 RepID=UPI00391C52FD
MNIVILGKGNMRTPLASLMQAAGHRVQAFSSTGNPRAALADAQVVVLALKYEQALEITTRADLVAMLAGKIVIDMTNPLAPDYMSLTLGHSSSAAEQIAQRLPSALVVKAFNTVFAGLLAKRAAGGAVDVSVFVAGDDATAVDTVVALSRGLGLEAIASGPLSNARYLEPMAEFMIQLGYGLGHGGEIGFKLVKAG